MKRETTFRCDCCGEGTETLHEGYCEPCRDEAQRILDEHNLSHDLWQRLTPAEREARIRWAMR